MLFDTGATFREFIAQCSDNVHHDLTGTKEWAERTRVLDEARRQLLTLPASSKDIVDEFEEACFFLASLHSCECYRAGFFTGIGMGATCTQSFLSVGG